MALTKCPECDTQVSDKADKCPNCAYPIATQASSKVQTIEQTGKKFKLQTLIGAILLVIGIPTFFIADIVLGQIIGLALVLIGIIVVIIAKVSVWWHHR